MKPAKIIWFSLGGLAIIGLLFIFNFSGDRDDRFPLTNETGDVLAPFETQVNKQGEVTVQVTPERDLQDKSRWNFEIVLDTHSTELNDDLVKAAVLIDSEGKEYQPASWEGDPAGGHHRKGVLRFDSVPPLTTLIELRIRGVGGVPERIFKWTLSK